MVHCDIADQAPSWFRCVAHLVLDLLRRRVRRDHLPQSILDDQCYRQMLALSMQGRFDPRGVLMTVMRLATSPLANTPDQDERPCQHPPQLENLLVRRFLVVLVLANAEKQVAARRLVSTMQILRRKTLLS